ncbi:phosphotransferase enzyme family protein [Mucilaginibacter boryungensis]|uniref:Aminoglycoside phosphotransferase family protein n=1 Tax=Mucilaginibacter boryungensis TaxID=768480 RepID=A0ABR9XLV4_9SPHI|nr:aminoglycoside phosphotransferase family protein [Mucilaginibacter boryungensis]MBE9668358.1 aminoglycoside phosphotransferase family protein [Mucilaginibacter boryungensis]
MLTAILIAFGLTPADYSVQPFGSGLINYTWKVSGKHNVYILQRINKNVFKSPQAIAHNLVLLGKYFETNYPDYLFVAPLPAINKQYLAVIDEEYYRLSPFIKNSHTVDALEFPEQAFEAAKQFGKFSRLLNGFDAGQLQYTLPDFHNLNLRVDQFNAALQNAPADRLSQTIEEVKAIAVNADIAETYRRIVQDKQIPLRVIHHDTKISNVLFNDKGEGLCVIDLDTVMPGYFISDLGDMMRTYLSPVTEEERDLDLVQINEANFAAIYKGYMQEMGDVLTDAEKGLFIYAGKFMIYMQALRFLTDFLNGDIYYPTNYQGHNLVRAQNQLTLLERYIQSEEKFKKLINIK